MLYNRERDVCFGRAFNSGHVNMGFWENFYNWVGRATLATPHSKVDGGPGWFIIDDQSAALPDAYIVVANHTAANVAANPNRYDEPHKILKCGYNTTEAGVMRIEAYLWWDVVTHTGYGRWASKYIEDYDAADFVYDFRGGIEQICISSRLGADWDNFFFGDWEGDANLVDGAHVVGTLQAGIVAGANVVIQLAANEAANFTEGHWAYLFDMNGHTWCNYVEILDVDAYNDLITIGVCNQNFPAGSVIGAYVHRYCIAANNGWADAVGGWTSCDNFQGLQIPYISRYGAEMNVAGTIIYQAGIGDSLSNVLGTSGVVPGVPGMSPNHRGQYACQRPVVTEHYNHTFVSYTDMNEAYGPIKNAWNTCQNNLLQMTDGRRINNLNHVYFASSSTLRTGPIFGNIFLVPDYDSIV